MYTNVLDMIDLAGVPVRGGRPPARAPAGRRSAATAAFNPEPLADFVDVVVLGEGEEVVGEITEVVARLEGVGPDELASRCCASSPRSPASTCRRCTTSTTTAPRLVVVTPRYADVPATVDKRTVADLGRVAVPEATSSSR